MLQRNAGSAHLQLQATCMAAVVGFHWHAANLPRFPVWGVQPVHAWHAWHAVAATLVVWSLL